MKTKSKPQAHWRSVFEKTLGQFTVREQFSIYLLYPLLSLLLVSRWFSDRMLLAYAEQGLQLFDPGKTLSVYKNIWLEIGLGIASPFYVSRIPYFATLSVLSTMGIPSWFIQATVFFLVLTIGMVAMTWLVSLLVKDEPFAPHIAAVLYLCNLYVMSQVLIRFIDALFFAWAFLPVFLFIWIQWLSQRTIRYGVFLIATSFIFSPVFSLLSSVLLIWIPAGLFSVTAFFTSGKKKQIFISSVTGVLLWLVSSLWWLVPIWQLKDNSYAEFGSTVNNITSLKEVSRFYPLSELLLLRQTFFFGENGPWAVLYQNWKFLVPSILTLVFVLVGFGIAIRKKYYFLITLFIVGFFFVKGTNPPFGEFFYNTLFTIVPPTQILRNPYEKIGLLFVLPYIIFAAIGVSAARTYLRQAGYICFGVFLIVSLVLVKPMFGKEFFPSPYHIQVPEYYSQANEFITAKTEKRIFYLPYLRNSSARYTWRFTGEEPSEFLFENTTLAKMSHIPSTDRYYLALEEYLSHKDFPKLLTVINVDTIVMHNDYVSEVNKEDLVASANEYVNHWDGISEKQTFGALDVYFINKYKTPGMFYTVDDITPVASMSAGFDRVLGEEGDVTAATFVIASDTLKMKPIHASDFKRAMVRYVKKSNQEFSVHVDRAEKPFILVFSMNFNPLWQAKIGETLITDHFRANGYANAWIVRKKGSYTIDIAFHY